MPAGSGPALREDCIEVLMIRPLRPEPAQQGEHQRPREGADVHNDVGEGADLPAQAVPDLRDEAAISNLAPLRVEHVDFHLEVAAVVLAERRRDVADLIQAVVGPSHVGLELPVEQIREPGAHRHERALHQGKLGCQRPVRWHTSRVEPQTEDEENLAIRVSEMREQHIELALEMVVVGAGVLVAPPMATDTPEYWRETGRV